LEGICRCVANLGSRVKGRKALIAILTMSSVKKKVFHPVILNGVKRNEESQGFFAEFILSGVRFFATLRMTRNEGVRMTTGLISAIEGESWG